MKREMYYKIITEEYLRLIEFKLDDLEPALLNKLDTIKDPKYKAELLANLSVRFGIPLKDLIGIVRKIYKDNDNIIKTN